MRNLGKDDNTVDGLTPGDRRNPFEVPEGYFPSLKKNILTQAKVYDLGETVFSTPEAYPQQLRQAILTSVSEDTLRAKVKQDGFAVPEHYFQTLSSTISGRVGTEAKVLPIRRTSRWITWAAAASVTLAVSMFAWMSNDQTPATDKPIQATIDVVPTDDIIEYLAYYSESGDLLTLSERLPDRSENFSESLSSEEIEAYLEDSI